MIEGVVYLGAAALVVLLLLHFLHFLRGSANLTVVVRGGRADVGGRALAAKRHVVRQFFENDLPAVRSARVRGYWDGHTLRLTITGDYTPGERQRIRNFLLAEL